MFRSQRRQTRWHTLAALGVAGALTLAAAPAEAAGPPRSTAMKWKSARHCSRPVENPWVSFSPCPGKFSKHNHVEIAGGAEVEISPGFDVWLPVSGLAPQDNIVLTVDGRFAAGSSITEDGTFYIQLDGSDWKQGPDQVLAFYNSNSQLIGWDYISVKNAW